MRILFITTSYPRYENDPLPAGNFVHELAVELKKKGAEVIVVAPHVKGLPGHFFMDDIEIYRVRYFFEEAEKLSNIPGGLPQLIAKRSPFLLLTPFLIGSMGLKLMRLAKSVDILHVHWSYNILSVIPIKLIFKKPIIVTIHGSDARLMKKLPGGKFMGNVADIIVTVNKEQKEFLEKQFENKVVHIPNGVKDNYASLPSPPPVIGTVGHFVQVKNFPTLARALKVLYDEGVEFKAMFIGDGDERGLIESIVEEFKDRVEITGYIPNGEVLKKLKELHIFVLPSFSEGRSIALLEAMATGRAIVVSRIPQNMELIKDGENGLLFDPYSYEELAEKLKVLIGNEQVLIKMAKKSYNTIKGQGLTWDKTAEKYMRVYRKLLEGGS